MSLDRDETHDMEVTLDHDAGLLRLLITVSDTRPSAGRSSALCQQLRRPTDHSTAVDKYNVRRLIIDHAQPVDIDVDRCLARECTHNSHVTLRSGIL